MSLDTQTPPILSLKEFVSLIKFTVETQFRQVIIRAEVSGVKRHSSGHTYFALKDDENVLDAVCWRGTSQPVPLEDGLEIIAKGRITVYGGRSRYQIVVESFEPAGQGALLKLLQERKDRLAKEGLFLVENKKPLPPFPQVIGIITSPTGAVIQDILHRLTDRYPCHVMVWPVPVQGEGAAEAVSKAIEGFQRIAPRPDLLIVARGGGSLEDLWCFNEEIVVRAAASSQIPLISAIGHETDTTLIDFAADVRAPTPTAAAELATPHLYRNLLLMSQEQAQRLNNSLLQNLERHQLHLKALSAQRLDPRRYMEEKSQRLDDWSERFVRSVRFSYERWDTPFQALGQRLDQASYKKVLDRGFAWVSTPHGKTISTQLQAQQCPTLKLTFQDGSISVKTSIERPKKPPLTGHATLF